MYSGGTVEIVTRESWGAKAAHYPGAEDPITADVVFMTESYGRPCSGGQECCAAVRTAQEWNMLQQRKADISYNFVIAGDGRVYEGRGWDKHPVLPYTFNKCTSCLSLGFIGNYSDADLPANMVKAMLGLIEYGRASGHISPDHQHHSLLCKLDRPVWRIMTGDPMVVSDTDSDGDGEGDRGDDDGTNISQLEIMNITRPQRRPWLDPIYQEEDKSYQDDWSEDYS